MAKLFSYKCFKKNVISLKKMCGQLKLSLNNAEATTLKSLTHGTAIFHFCFHVLPLIDITFFLGFSLPLFSL